jgi:D-beta-D-heptose 7-phosphate kinase/D-beta-D-heptose 1-phosphate adenosyltransferase
MTVARPVVVVGDALLDVDVTGTVRGQSPDAGVPVLDVDGEIARPGGAALAAVLLAGQGVPVTLATVLDGDADGLRLRELLEPALRLVAGPATGGTPVKRRWFDGDKPLLRTDTGEGRPASDGAGERWVGALEGADAVLVSDYGRGVAADPAVRAALAGAIAAGVPVVWDPHPKGPSPVRGVAVATPNLAEAQRAAGCAYGTATDTGLALLDRWGCSAVAVTVGADGAVLVRPGAAAHPVPAPAVDGGDPCGAGDAFAGALAAALAGGAPLPTAVRTAAAGAARFVGCGGARAVAWLDGTWRAGPVRGSCAENSAPAPFSTHEPAGP